MRRRLGGVGRRSGYVRTPIAARASEVLVSPERSQVAEIERRALLVRIGEVECADGANVVDVPRPVVAPAHPFGELSLDVGDQAFPVAPNQIERRRRLAGARTSQRFPDLLAESRGRAHLRIFCVPPLRVIRLLTAPPTPIFRDALRVLLGPSFGTSKMLLAIFGTPLLTGRAILLWIARPRLSLLPRLPAWIGVGTSLAPFALTLQNSRVSRAPGATRGIVPSDLLGRPRRHGTVNCTSAATAMSWPPSCAGRSMVSWPLPAFVACACCANWSGFWTRPVAASCR